MKIEHVFQDGLKELIEEKPLEDINVTTLCERVKSNRQTFYYHYRDISDVVESIFLKEINFIGKRLLDYESALKEMIAYINSNYKFVEIINRSYASDKLYWFMYSYFYMKVGILLKNHKTLGIDIARYISVLSAQELVFWIASKKKEKASFLQKRLSTIWHYLVNQYQSDLTRA